MDNDSKIKCFNFDEIDDKYNIDDGIFDGYVKRSTYGQYRYNLQASIWRKEAFYESWKNNETPWSWELYGNLRSWNEKHYFYSLKSLSDSPIKYGKKPGLTWGIVRGKWVYDDVEKLFKENSIHIDYAERGMFQDQVNNNNENRDLNIKGRFYTKIKSIGFKDTVRYTFLYIYLKIRYLIKIDNNEVRIPEHLNMNNK